MSHTPGPWESVGWDVRCKRGSVVCKVLPWDYSGTREEDRANLAIISAAPGLLEVLEEVEECSRYWSEYDVPIGLHDRIQAAIAKARVEQ